jgi:hypothetical protein
MYSLTGGFLKTVRQNGKYTFRSDQGIVSLFPETEYRKSNGLHGGFLKIVLNEGTAAYVWLA